MAKAHLSNTINMITMSKEHIKDMLEPYNNETINKLQGIIEKDKREIASLRSNIRGLQSMNASYVKQLDDLELKIFKYQRLSLFKRIFNYPR